MITEYEQEKKAIKEKYEKKSEKTLRNWFIGATAATILTTSSLLGVGGIKTLDLRKNYPPIYHTIYIDLENRSSKDYAKISSLIKRINITEQDSSRIMNTSEFKEYSEKRKKLENIIGIVAGSGIGYVFLTGIGIIFSDKFYRRRR